MSEHANPNDIDLAFSREEEPQGDSFEMPEVGVSVENEGTHIDPLSTPENFGVPVEETEEDISDQDGVGEDSQFPDDVDNPSSYKYYQSRFHRAEQENQALQERMQQMEAYLAQLASGQPTVTQPSVAGQQQMGPQSEASLRMPDKPQLPDDYDETDAFYDPDSQSYKYRIAQTQYLEEMGKWLESRVGQFDQRIQQVQAREQQQAREQAWRAQLSESYGMEESEQEAFMNMLNDPGMLTLPNMVKIFRALYGGASMQEPRQRKPKTPLPPTPSSKAQGAARQGFRNIEDQIINGMKTMDDPIEAAFGNRG